MVVGNVTTWYRCSHECVLTGEHGREKRGDVAVDVDVDVVDDPDNGTDRCSRNTRPSRAASNKS